MSKTLNLKKQKTKKKTTENIILSEYVLGYPVEWWGRRKTTVNVWDWIYFIFILYLWRMLLLLSVEMLLMPFHVLFLEISFLIDRADDIYLLQLSPLLQLYFEDILASLSTWNHLTHAWSLSKYWTARTKMLVIIRSIFYTLPCIKKKSKECYYQLFSMWWHFPF